MEEKDMRKEITNDNLDRIAGGKYVVNGNTHQVAFINVQQIYKLQNCTDYQAMEVMDSFIGQCATEEEYDNACIAALRERGWI